MPCAEQLMLFILLGQKCAFAECFREVVEQPIDGLESEIGHPDIVAVGINEQHSRCLFP